jgi:glutathione S-transferase
MRPKLYNTQRCPYARRTRIVLHEKGMDFEVHEVDLGNKSEEFLEISPTGKVPVIVVDEDSLYESNVVNQCLDEVAGGPKLMPEEARRRAYARIWISFADAEFFPAVFVASVGRDRGFSEGQISEAFEKLKAALQKLEGRGEASLDEYPNVAAWMERLEDRESYKAAV